MVGNFDDALLAFTEYQEGVEPHLLSRMGSTRTVYLINGVVYKICHEGGTENVKEFSAINANRDNLPVGVFYPEVSLFTIGDNSVIAMTYIEGQAVAECYCIPDIEDCDDSCMTPDIWNMVSPVLDDTGGLNVIINNEGIWIIDAA